MALSWKDSLALTQLASGEESAATPGYGAVTLAEAATYDNYANTHSGIEYNNNYLVFDVFNDSSISTIDLSKNVSVQSSQINITQEKNSQYIPFSLTRKADGYDLYNGVIWIVTNAGTAENQSDPYAIAPVNVYATDDKIYFGWLVDEWITRKAGQITFEVHIHGQVQGKDGDESVTRGYIWKSKSGTLTVTASKFDIDEIVEASYNAGWVNDIIEQAVENITYGTIKEYADSAEVSAIQADAAATTATDAVDSFNATVELAQSQIVELAETEVQKQIKDQVQAITWDQEIPIILGYEYTVTEDAETGHITDISITVADYVAEKLKSYYTKTEVDTNIATAIENADIEGKLTAYAKTSEVSAAIAASETLVKQYVDDEILAIDVTDQLKNYTEKDELGFYDEEGNFVTGDETTTVKDYIDTAIKNVDVTKQLADYGSKKELGFYDEEGNFVTGNETTTVKEYIDTAIENVDVTSQLDALKTEIAGTYAKASDVTDIQSDLTTAEGTLGKAVSDIADLNVAVKAVEAKAEAIVTYDINYDITNNQLSLWEYTDVEQGVGQVKNTVVITGGSGGSGGGSSITITRLGSSPLVVPAGSSSVSIPYKVEAFEVVGTELGEGLSQVTATWKLEGKTIKSETLTLTNGVYTGNFDITNYITTTKQRFLLTVVADDGTLKTKDWQAYEIDLSLEPAFDDSKVYSGNVSYKYIPYGNVTKEIHFILDDIVLTPVTTNVSGSAQFYTLPAQSHGSHLLEVYATTTIDEQTLESNHIYSDIMWYDESVGTTIIGSTYQNFTTRQYESTPIEYVVYVDSATETANVLLEASYVDAETGETVKEVSTEAVVDTGIKQIWTYKSDVVGEHTLTITCNGQTKTLIGTVVELNIDVEPITDGLVFDFDPTGYSNDSVNRVWSYTNEQGNTYSMALSDNFDWINGGYKLDSNNDQYFLIKAGTTATIDYELFGDDAKQTGKEFKLVFKTENVANGDTVFLDCLSEVEITNEEDGTTDVEQIGVQMKAHEATIYAKSESLPLPYAEEEIIEFEFNIAQKDDDVPMVMGYEDGVSTRPMVYDSTHEFQQRNNYKKQIVLGSTECDLLVYRFKVYGRSLGSDEILTNFITDARNADEMISRYDRNQIYDMENSGAFSPEYLATVCPDLRIIKIECPRFTTDKSDYVGETKIEMIYKNGRENLDNWYTTDCVHSGQGTSSNAYGPAGRNLDLILKKFSKKGVSYNTDPHIYYKDGTETTKVSLSETSIPVDYFNVKVNIASSENANNALLAKRYNQYNPYKRPFVREDESIIPYIKDTMEFYNCVIFLRETGEYADGSAAQFTEFSDKAWHFYAIGNIGDSKKTDDTRLTDPDDPYECIVEVMDNTLPLSTFPTGFTNDDGSPKYPITEDQWETMDNPAYSALMYEEFDEAEAGDKDNGLADTYGMRYLWEDGTDDENDEAFAYIKDKWREFYKFIVTASDTEFHDHLGDYVVLDSILYYYLFTLRYTMTDNHAKNCFWHYGKSNDKDSDGNAIRKWDLCFDYDNDKK